MRPAEHPLALLLDADELGVWRERQGRDGLTVVFTNGCFDLLHAGHVHSLQEAARHGDRLLVAINSDRTVRELKGEGRPVVDEMARATMLRALRWVDAVTIFDDPSVFDTLIKTRPDVLAKGGEYTEDQIVGGRELSGWGGKLVRLPMVAGFGTTQILADIQQRDRTSGSGKAEP